ncbi:TPA: S-layer homology domain-containing protein [Bacillus albus]|uniref:S-layer homology domain-containing protein n=1 Tax=Bacillus TaxID=1386 RepID=UPI002000DB7A|nr:MULTISPECIES: S-layer homology domain-containing protein [Bacillus]HDR7718042.1 S-layer homology domain-containing protein [Bacillus albus]MDA2218249.1 S-layer homology domain-containing protein [Bacillus cereus group sp. Bc228]MDA2228789.1 S-layer homology domain-containing protein [Bacillus cereus group sp. Bc227]MDA2262627.1 S-layer homology domain-containing protein [Bacillus cereus group sp. Bc200]MDA2324087.1 S-layer homology domain-containing protein [Bacillus cereus group sp. Bc177]
MKFKQLILAGTVIASTTLAPLTNVQAENTIEFKDVPEHHWSYKAIMDLQEKNIVSGYGDGRFGFGDNITRGQVARMLYAYLKPADEPNLSNPYKDVKNHMFEKEILTLSKAGIISGFGDGRFGPDSILTREQLAAVLTNAFHLKATSTTTFKDVNKNYWATNAISALQENKIAAGMGDNMFEPYKIVTREQYAQFLYNAIIKFEKPEIEPDSKPTVIPQELADDDIYYYEGWMESSSVLKKSVSKDAQNYVTQINTKYNAELKYATIGGPGSEVVLFSPVLEGIPEFYGNFTVRGDDENNFTVNFVIDRGQDKKALMELGKKWITMINPNLDLSTEIDNIVASNTRTGNFDINKNNLKIEISIEKQNSSSDLMSVKIQK